MRCRRMKAALVILRAYRRYKVKSYIREVNRRFRNVRSMKDYGRQVKWPTPPKVLRRLEEALRSIHSRCSIQQLSLFHKVLSGLFSAELLAGGTAHSLLFFCIRTGSSEAAHVCFRRFWHRAAY